jgi:hypothetical protein
VTFSISEPCVAAICNDIYYSSVDEHGFYGLDYVYYEVFQREMLEYYSHLQRSLWSYMWSGNTDEAGYTTTMIMYWERNTNTRVSNYCNEQTVTEMSH